MVDCPSTRYEFQLPGFLSSSQILEAIAKAKQENKVLIVYLTGKTLFNSIHLLGFVSFV
jgi:hypothetical protein